MALPSSDPGQNVGSTTSQPDSSNNARGEIDQATAQDEDVANGEYPLSDGEGVTDLAALGAVVRDQDDLERDIGQQADQLLTEQAIEREQKRLQKTLKEKERMQTAVKIAETNLAKPAGSATKNKYRAEIEHYNALIANLDNDIAQIQKRIDDRQESSEQDGETLLEQGANKRLPGESQREFLIRTGKITPFSKMGRQLLKTSSSLGELLLDEDQQDEDEAEEEQAEAEAEASIQAGPKRRLTSRRQAKAASVEPSTAAEELDAAYVSGLDENGMASVGRSGDAAESEDDDAEGDFTLTTAPPVKRSRKGKQKQKAITNSEDGQEDLAGIDDGNEQVYQARLQSWTERRSAARKRAKERRTSMQEDADHSAIEEAKPEWQMPHPTRADAEFEGGFRIPGDIYPSLFDYQKTGVQWLWELYSQQVGGIIGDEMGLGKTIQIISFLAGLHYSGKIQKPIIVVCPATVMKQWVNEFHRWWPPLRVSILHTSGSGMLDVGRENRYEEALEAEDYSSKKTLSKGQKAAKRILDTVTKQGHVLVTTYSGLQTYAELLIPTDWEYAVLDEGHKIRNPNTAITIYCKELCTHNRVILSGTPMQNNLTELWSLFDFVFPMRLGTLVNFKNQFEIPIKHGGYANASNLQVETAMKCAETLKDAISPYLLQRFKVDVAADLPKKSERVLFCKLTKLQREAYQWFLDSEDMKSIMNGKRQALYGVDILRKICNHPDLVEHRTLSKKSEYNYGDGRKSGKMQVVKSLLQEWKRDGHKTLLFAQHRIMLDILERFIGNMAGFSYRRMDGTTPIKERQNLVDEFNNDPDLHVFLLTTKVGGLGVNLTGANRVIIYDPDWNPSTDVQARERAWRLGQKREVLIYRLMTAGTIEEKIYHRQIFKQFLTNKILKDPKQRQTFQLKDLHDLFTLGDSADGQTETGNIFKGTEVKFKQGNLSTPEDGTAPAGDDLSKVAGISRQEEFHGEDDGQEDNSKGSNKEDRMLSSIFAGNGVASVQDHDAIINGRKTVRADPTIIQREAKRVAAEAARELERAGEIARSLPAGVPTWTGQVGTAGRSPSPPPRRGGMRGGMRGGRGGRGGPSSSSVLANLQNRHIGSAANTAAGTASSAGSRDATPVGRGRAALRNAPQGRDFLKLIRDFMMLHDGVVPAQMLVDQFDRLCRGSPERTMQFKEMLRTIATLEKGSTPGRSKWRLKEEYRPPPRA
ncbi:uncharacterized protein MYCFIDRAFT_46188 [Pseudocercospora fijiensis CIRAD86]|uniref:Uncharacterized protein n=1 Tax=Pseudocercospora fijiensis (strain CIRAD86) TaxID=383855 RepID=N1QBI8_PSEFD|nr:uncharacterized protein MYCFIDRAFT_46188 [Pseudocercospora fijiensis CIRAD86]EME88518.1 hypothetical protein MYCFIDRAFT_46188 [Pseudocercospora fijiensis CIRAD86]